MGLNLLLHYHHFEMPYHLVKKYGGFRNRKVIEFFVRYSTAVMKRYKDKVKYWMTFNEINNQKNLMMIYLHVHVLEFYLMKDDNREEVMYQAVHHELVASALVVKKGHEINPDFKIGCMCCICTYLSILL